MSEYVDISRWWESNIFVSDSVSSDSNRPFDCPTYHLCIYMYTDMCKSTMTWLLMALLAEWIGAVTFQCK
jgi:hypothetical protein